MLVFDNNVIQQLQEEFTQIAFNVFRKGRRSDSVVVCETRIRAWCGVPTSVIAKTWKLLEDSRAVSDEMASKERFLWALHLLKAHNNESTMAAFCNGVDESTFRRWAWHFVEEMSCLESTCASHVFVTTLLFETALTCNVDRCCGTIVFKMTLGTHAWLRLMVPISAHQAKSS